MMNPVNNESKTGAKRSHRYWGLIIPAIVVIIVMVAAAVHINTTAAQRRAIHKSSKAEYFSLLKTAAATEKIKKQRINFFKSRFFLDFPQRYAYDAADFIRRLSLVFPQGLKLDAIEIKPAGQGFTFILEGGIGSSIAAGTQQEQTLQRLVHDIEGFEQVVTAGLGTAADRESGQAPGRRFTITGQGEIR